MTSKSKIIVQLVHEKRLIVDFRTGLVSYVRDGVKTDKYFYLDKDGYKIYQIKGYGERFNIRGQRLVFLAAGGKIPLNHDIHHKDGVRANNRLLNLACVHQKINRGKNI